MSKIKELYIKYKEIFWYLVIGGLTTLVNIFAYFIFAHPLSLDVLPSTVLAWFVSVVFAYVSNKIIVFESKTRTFKLLLIEIILFFASRIATGALDTAIMFIFAEKLLLNDIVVKIVSNIVVIILNYILSKLLVFRKRLDLNNTPKNEKTFEEVITLTYYLIIGKKK